MARNEQDREDLLREATALVERIEIQPRVMVATPDAAPDSIVIGFRRDGCASFFFGVSPVWQFNRAGELRRGYYEGRLLKAERGRLIAMQRERHPDEVFLVREELSREQERLILEQAEMMLRELQALLAAARFTLVGQVPAEGNVCQQVQAWLEERPRPLKVAERPHAK